MIEVLGIKRIIIIGVLVVTVSVLAAAHFLMVLPQQESAQRELKTIENNISSTRANIQKLQEDFATLGQVRSRFDAVKQYGFFFDQNRVIARSKINEMKTASGVLSAKYTMGAVEDFEDEKLKSVKYKLMQSPVKFNIQAYDDVDVYKFIYLLNYGFPGTVQIKMVTIERTLDVSSALLRNIGTGSKTPLVNAIIQADWYTVAPITVEDEVEER